MPDRVARMIKDIREVICFKNASSGFFWPDLIFCK